MNGKHKCPVHCGHIKNGKKGDVFKFFIKMTYFDQFMPVKDYT